MFPLATRNLPPPKNSSFAERIRAVRERLNLSQTALARQWGFSRALLGMWENGSRNPSGLYREKLERALKKFEE
jgi:DNA-binding transcriptional regulator YiaG